jgi:hypothetical protein
MNPLVSARDALVLPASPRRQRGDLNTGVLKDGRKRAGIVSNVGYPVKTP